MSATEVDRDKLRQKIQYIRDSVRRLEEIRARGEEAFLADPILQAAATRFLQTGSKRCSMQRTTSSRAVDWVCRKPTSKPCLC